MALPLAACAAMNSPANSSALPPISPIITMPLVCTSGWVGGGGRLRGRTGRGVAGGGGRGDGGGGGRAGGQGGRAGGQGGARWGKAMGWVGWMGWGVAGAGNGVERGGGGEAQGSRARARVRTSGSA